ncbi:MAG: sigma factor, partial [Streptosporangiaceae bacterium]
MPRAQFRGAAARGGQYGAEQPEPTEDLMQVGYAGLLKAINNFDAAGGDSLAAYAQPSGAPLACAPAGRGSDYPMSTTAAAARRARSRPVRGHCQPCRRE